MSTNADSTYGVGSTTVDRNDRLSKPQSVE